MGNNSSNTGMNMLLALLLAIVLTLVGVIMMNVQVSGVDNHLDRIEVKVDNVAHDVDLIKYGQQLLAAGQGQPIVVTK